MFGLNDNNRQEDSQQSDAAAGSVPGMTPPIPGPRAATIMPPTSSPAPSLLIDTTPVVAAPPAPTIKASDSNTGNVNLENAYIPTGGSGSDEPIKPTAASLLQDPPPEDELLKLKQQALQSLAPLVDQLDQSAEEKFKTTMMLIQASDNPELVQEAYDAANKIQDEKARAHALLDVVNEINYFTQHHQDEAQA